MSKYSVAEAKNNFSRLIDEANGGESVVVTRHGKPVAQIVPIVDDEREARRKAFERMVAGRLPYVEGAPDSVELLRQVYEEEP